MLLITPGFHGMWQGVAAGFTARGYDVRTHLYDNRPSALAKTRYKLAYELPRRAGRSRDARLRDEVSDLAIQAVANSRPDCVLVIKGELLTAAFWDAVDRSEAKRLLWLYDDLGRLALDPQVVRRAASVATFSESDVRRLSELGVDAHHLPLAFDAGTPAVPSRAQPHVVFAGARYPRRVALLRGLAERGVDVVAYGRDWSKHPVDRLRTWELRRPPVPAGRDLPREVLYGRLASAEAALNIHDGAQDGFNLRTFEACGVGGLQLIDREDVSQFYDIGDEILVYRTVDELVDLVHRAQRDRPWRERVARAGRRRTLADHTVTNRVSAMEEWWA